MNKFPRISIITPSYNQGEYIEKTIKSILSQEYPNLEYIIIDGGSTDNTIEIIKKYENDITYWVSEPDKGQTDALKKGFSMATGDFFLWVNSDDYLLPDAINKFVDAHIKNPSADLIVGLGRRSDPNGNIFKSDVPIGEITLDFLFNWMEGPWFCQPSSMFSRKVWEDCGPFNEKFRIAFDLDFWIKAKKQGFQFSVINDYLSVEIFHDGQHTARFRRLTHVEIVLVIINHGGEDRVRGYLDEMARKLTWYETNYKYIKQSKIFKIIYKINKVLLRKNKLLKYEDTNPPWGK